MIRCNVFTLAAIVLTVSPAIAQQTTSPPLISVTGSAEVKVAPDEVILRLGVETRQDSLEAAKKQNDERVSKVLAFLKENKVESKHVQTDFINIEPVYDINVSRLVPVAYFVRKSIEVKLTDVKSFERVLTSVLANGVTNVHGIEFRTSELRKHRDMARAMAIRAAKEKADALASELGVVRGKVQSVNANEWGGWYNSAGGSWGRGGSGAMFQNAVQDAGGSAETDSGTLSAGQISISASVNVSFVIQ